MATYSINKGVGKTVEVKGLTAPYLLWFLLGMLLSFLLFFLLLWISFPVALVLSISLLIATIRWCYYANRTYGQYGLMHRSIQKKLPSRIAMNTPIHHLIESNEENLWKNH